jgi:hypothetical protein
VHFHACYSIGNKAVAGWRTGSSGMILIHTFLAKQAKTKELKNAMQPQN